LVWVFFNTAGVEPGLTALAMDMTMDIGIGCRWHQQSSTPPVLDKASLLWPWM
jgi:hypothetical protein